MSTYLQKQIQTRLDEKKLNINALGKKAGLKRSAARNILLGYSKKPSADTLKAIADVLGCTVDDLIGSSSTNLNSFFSKINTASQSSYPWNEKLYLESMKVVTKILKAKKLDLKFEQVTSLIQETYKYSMSKKSEKIDQDFVNWVVDNNF